MSLPIKIVEGSNHPPEKDTENYQSNLLDKNQIFLNSSFNQSSQYKSPFSSPTLNNNLDLTTPLNSTLFYNENSLMRGNNKDNKESDYESTINLKEEYLIKSRKNSFVIKNGEEKMEQKKTNYQDSNSGPCGFFSDFEQKKQDLHNIKLYNINNKFEYSIQQINHNNESNNFNICPNTNIKINNNEMKNYFNNLKEYSDKIIQTLKLIYKKNENLLNSSKGINFNETIKNIRNNKYNKYKNKDMIINLINPEDNKTCPEPSSYYGQKKLDKNQLLKSNKLNKSHRCKRKNIKEDNYINNITHINKVKPLKRINNRKFNVKSRGLRYNILTEEIKKQLLSDAMNMRTVEVAKKYGISTRNVNRWKKKGIERKKGSGRKFKDPRLERKILEWYFMQDKETLTSRQFKAKAIELSDNKTFRASSGWLTNMKRKYNLTFKKY